MATCDRKSIDNALSVLLDVYRHIRYGIDDLLLSPHITFSLALYCLLMTIIQHYHIRVSDKKNAIEHILLLLEHFDYQNDSLNKGRTSDESGKQEPKARKLKHKDVSISRRWQVTHPGYVHLFSLGLLW